MRVLLLAPTIGEYLLGNIAISQYGDVLFLLPLSGAVVVAPATAAIVVAAALRQRTLARTPG